MSEELENSVREMLKAETWTRSGIGNFTVDNLNELSGILDKTHKEAAEDVIMGICDEQLQKTKDCVSALFIKGMLSLREQNYESKEIVFEGTFTQPVKKRLFAAGLISKMELNDEVIINQISEKIRIAS